MTFGLTGTLTSKKYFSKENKSQKGTTHENAPSRRRFLEKTPYLIGVSSNYKDATSKEARDDSKGGILIDLN